MIIHARRNDVVSLIDCACKDATLILQSNFPIVLPLFN